jgi:hypothetical protein
LQNRHLPRIFRENQALQNRYLPLSFRRSAYPPWSLAVFLGKRWSPSDQTCFFIGLLAGSFLFLQRLESTRKLFSFQRDTWARKKMLGLHLLEG